MDKAWNHDRELDERLDYWETCNQEFLKKEVRTMSTWIARAGVVFMLAAMPAAGDDSKDGGKAPDDKGVAQQIKAIVAKYESSEEELGEKFGKANQEEKKKIRQELEKLQKETANQLLEMAQKHAKDPGIFAAFDFMLYRGLPLDRAIAIVEQHQLQSKEVGSFCFKLSMGDETPANVERLIREVAEKNPHDEAKGLAALALARVLKARSEQDEVPAPDQAKQRAEAEKWAALVVEKFAKVKIGENDRRSRNAGDMANSMLFEIRFLAIGKTVPEIAGEDVEGKKFKLSDYRGKVVLLDFWAFW
jgi:hypothetical protein